MILYHHSSLAIIDCVPVFHLVLAAFRYFDLCPCISNHCDRQLVDLVATDKGCLLLRSI